MENITISPPQEPMLTPLTQSSSKIPESLSEPIPVETPTSIKNLTELALEVDLNQGFGFPIKQEVHQYKVSLSL